MGRAVSEPLASSWTLEEGVDLVRSLEPALSAVGYHVALAGGVFLRGSSDHDLDVVVFPHRTTRKRPGLLRAALRAVGGELHTDAERVREHWRAIGSDDQKHVEIWKFGGKRVDVIMMECH